MDLLSVSVSGAFNYARARVVWRDGMLRVYTLEGLRLELTTKRPIRRPQFLNTWDVETGMGNFVLKGKCVTCGGPRWWRVTSKPFDELWMAPV